MKRLRTWLPLSCLVLSAAICERRPSGGEAVRALPWDAARVLAHLKIFAAEEHVMGSPRQRELAAYIKTQMSALAGVTAASEDFKVQVPDPDAAGSPMRTPTLELTLQNVYALMKVEGASCTIMLASHYDSKRLSEGPSLGANDSGSSSAALLEIMQVLSGMKDRLPCSILAVWFDGEEAYLKDWQDGEFRHPARIEDHLYGSRHLAAQLRACGSEQCLPPALGGGSLRAMILLDMIGLPHARLARDESSDPQLLEQAIAIDREAFDGRYFGSSRRIPVQDDHIPFRKLKVPALDLIDFENLATWHTREDRIETLSPDSIREIAQIAMTLILRAGKP